MNADYEYLDALDYVMQRGEERIDRTGIGTRSIFGLNLSFDNRDTFPILTTKRVHFKSVVGELLWFLSGSTNNNDLVDKYGVTIWNEWADDNGNLGPIYSHQWRNFGAIPKALTQPRPQVKQSYAGYVAGESEVLDMLFSTWKPLMQRCYRKTNSNYSYYGGRGVYVCDEWHNFMTFAEDVQSLDGWEHKLNDRAGFQLDKDIKGNGFVYSPEVCSWVSKSQNMRARNQKTYLLSSNVDGEVIRVADPTAFREAHGIRQGNFDSMLRGERKSAGGWSLLQVDDPFVGVDQMQNLIDGIKADPYSRRHIVNAWNVGQIDQMALPPCHTMFQCYVHTDGTLDLQLYQRSSDMFLGLPFNIAQYALLQRIIADITGYRAGKLHITIGDAHIYSNHFEQVQEQLARVPKSAPTLMMDELVGLDYISPEAFRLIGYGPHPTIKAPVAV